MAVGLKLLEAGEEPTGLPGVATWDWVETWFTVAISTEHLTEVSMTQLLPPSWPLTWEAEERLAVWICGVDPAEDDLGATEWPIDYDTGEQTGLVLDPDLPGDDSYLWISPFIYRLSDLGMEGGWVIQAVIDDAGKAPVDPFGVDAITPSSTELGVVAEVELSGEGFEEGMIATIGGLELAELEVVEEGTATGRSPSGLPVGLHDLRLVSPDGEEALLTSAFQVTSASGEGDGGGEAEGGGETDGGGSGDDDGKACGALPGPTTIVPLLLAGLLGWSRRR